MAKKNTYFQDEELKTKIDLKQFARTLSYILPFKKIFITVCILMTAGSIFFMIPPIILKQIVNHTVASKNIRELILLLSSMTLLAGITIVFNYFQQILMGRMGHSVIANIRRDIFTHLQHLSFEYFDSRPDGKIVVRVTDYINELANFFSNFVLQFLIYFAMIIVSLVFMFSISWQLALIVLASAIPMMAGVLFLRKALKPMFTKLRFKNSNRSAFLVESLMGEKIIKNCNQDEASLNTLKDIHTKCYVQWEHIVAVAELNTPVTEIFWNLGTLSLFAASLASMLFGNGSIDAGTVIAFTGYMGLFSTPLTQIAMVIQNLAQVTSNLEQVFDTIDFPVSIKDKEDAVTLKNIKGKVDFNDVTFSYEEGVPVLEHFNLHVNPGETIALVGPTGAGKTTVINMLTRFYDIEKGSLTIDGYDIKDVKLNSLRHEIGVLMQDPFIFKGTILENIRYGKPDASDKECIEAAEKIHADTFIKRFSDGYNHPLEERGSGLSAGEKQLLSFTRIILKNPSVIILDEATSSIDTETELLIQKALDVILKDKTAFIVAHRLSTIKNSDRILYIANKTIAEEGNHEELMKKKGLYYHLTEN
ncbi:ABC transporter ATP-binding protein [Treponema rectale]|uniref:ABC transporter ATP-binding protein n=1 Tax=Treponema rectale TaxID=744512 RepID=A0A840SEW3_9SPIR|nr:ABC transporter ATP-binding protein [Treponema rectale]MBB5219280.1 ATP-binding cassette subfamily B protein [Treponema rectale]QOS40835.1 ABC transporter ATP-binding protein [Treponema rectale]